MPSPGAAARAWTLVEVLLVIGLAAILFMLLLPARVGRSKSPFPIRCFNNQKQIGLALRMFADDNNGQFPPQVSITNGGSMEFSSSNSAALHFRALSNYLGGALGIWHCPADQSKQPLTNKSALTDQNLSYFISVDATPVLTNAILAGDRNLQVAGQPVEPGLFTLTTNTAIGWTREMHKFKRNVTWVGCGNVLFVDGHVQRFEANLPIAIQRQGLATNRLAVP
jgi:prepilin-type processing-associated H-X9-DG protein